MDKDRGIMVRTNSRIWPDQDAFIKKKAEESKGKMGVGEVHRMVIDDYINRSKKK